MHHHTQIFSYDEHFGDSRPCAASNGMPIGNALICPHLVKPGAGEGGSLAQGNIMRINFTSTTVPLRAGKRLKRQLSIPESLALECTAFVLGYASWHELNAQLRKEPVTDLDEKVSAEELATRRSYQLQRLVQFWASRQNAPSDLAAVLAVWQPSAARPQESVNKHDIKTLTMLLLRWGQQPLPLSLELENTLVEGLQAGVDAETRNLALILACDALSEGKQPSFRLARRVLEVFAADEDPGPAFNLAMALIQGHGGPADPARAASLLQRISASPRLEQRHRAQAITVLGTLQALGLGRPVDTKKAFVQWGRGAAEGNVEAAFNAALTLMMPEAEGRAVDAKTREQATKLYRQAARKGHVPSMTNLGLLLIKYPELCESFGEHVFLLEEAAERGDSIATHALDVLDRSLGIE